MIISAYILATLAMLLIVAGLITARQQQKHVRFMLAAFVCDMIGLVLVEFGPMLSGQVDPVSSVVNDPGPMKVIHASLATAAVVLYVVQIISGRKVMAGDRTKLIGHKKTAGLFLLMRVLAYITMFMV